MTTRCSRRVRLGWVAVVCALTSGALAACDVKVGEGGLSVDIASGKASDEWTKSYDVVRGGQLEIVNVNGPIEARPSPDGRVEVRAFRAAMAQNEDQARRALEHLAMEAAVQPDHVSIRAKLAEDAADGGLGRRPRLSIRYEVRVPKGLRVTLRTQNGTVTAEGLDGALVASTTNGGINGSQLSGPVEATTVNGGVRVDMVSLAGDLRLSAVNGGVLLELPQNAGANVDATAVNGGVTIDERLAGSSVRRDDAAVGPTRQVSATLNGGGARVGLHTTNGGVRVVVRGSGPPRS